MEAATPSDYQIYFGASPNSSDVVAVCALLVAVFSLLWHVYDAYKKNRESINDHFWFRRTIDQNLLGPLDKFVEEVFAIQESASSFKPIPSTSQTQQLMESIQNSIRRLFWQFQLVSVFNESFREKFELKIEDLEDSLSLEIARPFIKQKPTDWSKVVKEVIDFRIWNVSKLREIHRKGDHYS